MKLKAKTALITGGNSGIGLATARLFVAEGTRVAITGRNRKTLDAAADELAFDEVLRTNVTAVFLTIQAALPLLQAGASIILNGSISATTGLFRSEMSSFGGDGAFHQED
jgi:NAD(P)-dependent dehydrogenase (short-subunit alcohol dehydrogenase family)